MRENEVLRKREGGRSNNLNWLGKLILLGFFTLFSFTAVSSAAEWPTKESLSIAQRQRAEAWIWQRGRSHRNLEDPGSACYGDQCARRRWRDLRTKTPMRHPTMGTPGKHRERS